MHLPPLSPNLRDNCPWVKEMEACVQDPVYHAEGNVWTHTLMVREALLSLPAFKDLPEKEQTLLEWAALLHDCAKPETRIFLDGRVQNPKHSLKGSYKARLLFWELGADQEAQTAIFNLVRFHGLPPHILEKNTSQMLPRLSQALRLDHLSLLAQADMTGRSCKDRNQQLEKIETCKLFLSFAQELGCDTKPYPFKNGLSRISFCENPAATLPYERCDNTEKTMTLLMGLPASGKTTIRNQYRLPFVSLDQIRRQHGIDPQDEQGTVTQIATEECKILLRQKQDFLFDATNTTKMVRRRWLDLARTYGFRTAINWVSAPPKETFERNQNREEQVPKAVITKLALNLEPPQLEDTWEVIHTPTCNPSRKK